MKLSVLLEFYNELIIKQDYFECHEIMEDAWKEKPVRNKEDPEVFLILIAVGEYHYRRQNIKGAVKLMERALELYNENQYDLGELGLNTNMIHKLSRRKDSVGNSPFKPMNFPLTDSIIHMLYTEYVTDLNFHEFKRWTEKYINDDEFIIHKHLMRDKSHVHKSREDALKKRKHQK